MNHFHADCEDMKKNATVSRTVACLEVSRDISNMATSAFDDV